MISLTACTPKVKTVFVPQIINHYPPAAYVVRCDAIKPDVPSIGNVIASLEEAVLRCNRPLESIRSLIPKEDEAVE